MRQFSGKTVLVTGATGLIGSHIVEALMAINDVRLIALGRNENKLKGGFAKYINSPNFDFLAQDISEPLNLSGTVVDYIFHAASPMEPEIIANYPVDVIMANIQGTQNCLEYLRMQEEFAGVKGRFVLFSSITVYGNILEHDRMVSEADTEVAEVLESNRAPYSQSKRMSEVIVQAYRRQYNMDVVIARFSTVYGDTMFKPNTAFFEFVDTAISGRDIVLNGTRFARRDNIYIDDAVSAVLLVCQKGVNGQAYNISSNSELGNYAAIDEIAITIANSVNQKNEHASSDHKVKVLFKNGKSESRKAGILMDNSKLKSLGWSPQTSLLQGIYYTIDSVVTQKH